MSKKTVIMWLLHFSRSLKCLVWSQSALAENCPLLWPMRWTECSRKERIQRKQSVWQVTSGLSYALFLPWLVEPRAASLTQRFPLTIIRQRPFQTNDQLHARTWQVQSQEQMFCYTFHLFTPLHDTIWQDFMTRLHPIVLNCLDIKGQGFKTFQNPETYWNISWVLAALHQCIVCSSHAQIREILGSRANANFWGLEAVGTDDLVAQIGLTQRGVDYWLPRLCEWYWKETFSVFSARCCPIFPILVNKKWTNLSVVLHSWQCSKNRMKSTGCWLRPWHRSDALGSNIHHLHQSLDVESVMTVKCMVERYLNLSLNILEKLTVKSNDVCINCCFHNALDDFKNKQAPPSSTKTKLLKSGGAQTNLKAIRDLDTNN